MALDDTGTKLESVSNLATQYDRVRRGSADATLPAKPIAFSVDGRTFGYEAQVRQAFRVGSYVSIKTKDANYLGQVTAQDVATRDGPQYGIIATSNAGLVMGGVSKGSHFLDRVRFRYVQGGGELIGRLTPDGIERAAEGRAFDEAELEPASGDMIALHLTATDTTRLDIGYALGVEPPGKVRVQLQPKGFYRHTFMCGQSRSGKTFALGVMLERLLLADGAFRIIILDPNSDFVRIDKIRAKDQYDKTLIAPCSNEEYSAIKSQLSSSIRILRPLPFNPSTLKVRLSDLDPGEQGAVLQLHPTRDLDAFNTFSRVVEGMGGPYSWEIIKNALVSDARPSALDLIRRIQNLRVADWRVWCQTDETAEPSMPEILRQENWRGAVVDVGSLPSPDERAVSAIAVLNYLWKAKDPKKPVLLVIDEAHNICPQEPANPIQEIATDYIVRIAGEGLKYGLRLLLVSQRPAKIHASVLTQCENLVLMRMTSRADIESLSQTFSQVSPTLMARSRYFVQGESLVVGEIAKSPTFAKFEGRISHEGA
jgi:DNA helicase HerA-like ATPase